MNQTMGLWQRAALMRAGFAKIPSTYVSFPEPRPRGLAARGIQYISGNFIIDGEVVEAPGQSIWTVGEGSRSHRALALGFEWVDDLVACGSKPAMELLRNWFDEFLANHEKFSGEIWVPEQVSARLIRMVNHGAVFLQTRDASQQKEYFRTVSQHYKFLGYTWTRAQSALSKATALVALVFAAHATQSPDTELDRHVETLARFCDDTIGQDGGIDSRNPEELMQIFSLLSWTSRVLEALGKPQDKSILKALERIAPCLRALRFANGSLTVFQGGGPGMPGRLDQALADGRVRFPAYPEGAMGFARLAANRSILISDAGQAQSLATASAFEFAAGRHPIFVNSGASDAFGERWADMGRRAIAHNMAVVDRADCVSLEGGTETSRETSADAETIIIRHSGYMTAFGLMVERRLTLANDGTMLGGEDKIYIPDGAAMKTFKSTARGADKLKLPVGLHFHLAPEVEAEINMGGSITSISLPNDQVWGFRQSGGKLSLKPSVLMAPNRLRPLATQQILVAGEVSDKGLNLTWILERLS